MIQEAPKIDSNVQHAAEIIGGRVTLAPVEQNQLQAVVAVIAGFNILQNNAWKDGIVWAYHNALEEEEKQGTLYVPFGYRQNGLLAVTYHGQENNLTFIRAEAFWQDKYGTHRGLVVSPVPSTAEKAALFYHGNSPNALRLYKFGTEQNWYEIRGLPKGISKDRFILDYNGRNPIFLDRHTSLESLQTCWQLGIVNFHFR